MLSSARVEYDHLLNDNQYAARVESPKVVEASYPLFIIYTSGSTGKPKGIVHAHSYIAGLMMTVQSSFDVVPGVDVVLVLASFGWITG